MDTTFQKINTEPISMDSKFITSTTKERCYRCDGLMVTDHCLDLSSDTREVEIVVSRCIQCGEMIDPTIIKNRYSFRSSISNLRQKNHWGRAKSFGLPLETSSDTSRNTTTI